MFIFTDPIACEDCRMAWLIRDHHQLLSHLTFFPLCSNGSDFMDLNPDGYSKCQKEEIVTTEIITKEEIITTEKMPSITLDFVEPAKVVPQSMDDSISMASVEPDNDNNGGNNATASVTILYSPLICCVILALSFCYFEVFTPTK